MSKQIIFLCIGVIALAIAGILFWNYHKITIHMSSDQSSTQSPSVNDPSPETMSAAIVAISSEVKDGMYPAQKIFIIDNSLIFVRRDGLTPDSGYSHLLFDMNRKKICSYTDSIKGPQLECADPSKAELFTTIVHNLNEQKLGLPGHSVMIVPEQ